MAKKVNKTETEEVEISKSSKMKTSESNSLVEKKSASKVAEVLIDGINENQTSSASKSKQKSAKNVTEVVETSPKPISSEPVRYSDEDLDMFAEVINEAKSEALDELRMLKERLEDLTSFDAGEESMIYSMHMAEQGSEAQEKEKTYAQIQRISEHIKKLDDAMDRIRNKTYGICRVCGCLIAKERLLAVPITTLSASYKIHSRCPEDGLDKIEPVKM